MDNFLVEEETTEERKLVCRIPQSHPGITAKDNHALCYTCKNRLFFSL